MLWLFPGYAVARDLMLIDTSLRLRIMECDNHEVIEFNLDSFVVCFIETFSMVTRLKSNSYAKDQIVRYET